MSYYKIKLGMSGPFASTKEIWGGFVASSPDRALERINTACVRRGLVVNAGSFTEIGQEEYQHILDSRKQMLLALEHLLYSSSN